MKSTRANPLTGYVGEDTAILLEELRTECKNVSTLLAQLEVAGLPQDQIENLLGDLSVAILHLHEHTRGLDEQLLESGE